ncbi:exopolyphosphatase [Ornithobacterium rhinotracheale]|nr:exopolyphosphatase [Ornithobacterium rhinotracheale]MBN3662198.1 exopolyphosphatase [Ornithobacterium rhinotracheale]MCK0194811.1 exopolyphosphatase [Ornithobacterium rhinotracheale]MCK0200722.1 exopolyphosphatase [Ornithobacterium rhinotracheale]UOH64733.1 exopolyphosphatase [Ornithobacterium rhinotracheale]UOH66979.1 exopolyphosphatase [Ornithobacterium rhinotracheale]
MMKITKLAAIDIGSNAVRLLVCSIYNEEGRVTFNKTSLVRVPIRLGEDAFVRGEISEENEKRLIQAMTAYKLLMDVHQVQGYSAFATSAMREVKNGKKIVKKIREKAGVDLEIIDGQKEGQIIFETELKEYVNDKNSYLYIDVGGGSTELTVLAHGKVLNTRSFDVGTVRWLNGKVDASYLVKEVKPWVIENCKDLGNIEMIGSGGNINHIFKYSGKKKALSFTYLNQQRKILSALDFEDRLSIYNMKPDRADVIVPALEIYTSVMKFAKAKKMHVPKIGLADGMVQYMYHHKK